MASFVPLSSLLATGRPADATVCLLAEGALAWREFAGRAGAAARALAARPEQRWLIRCEAPSSFAAALLGALHAGKRAVVAPGLQPGMIEALRAGFDAIVGDSGAVDVDLRVLAAADFRFSSLVDSRIDLFTSGSAGEPKRVEKSLAQLETEARTLEACWGKLVEGATMVATVPHHHIYGMLFRLAWPLSAGRPFDDALCADPNVLLERIAKARSAAVISSPAHLTRLPELIELESLRRGARVIFSSGGPLPAATALEFARRFGAAPLEVYGSTETGGIAWRAQSEGPAGADWMPFPGMALELDAEGALRLRSPYLESSDWLTLADSAELLPSGRFRLKGRLDRVAKIEGKRVSLPELEAALRAHPWVRDAAVVQLAGRRERLGAVVVLREPERLRADGARKLAAALRTALLERFDRVLVPRHWRFPARLPADERGKLPARALAALFEDPRDDAPAP
ncbi:MAG TPA: AMP-binding protein [Burkholderiales bacterium]|nr:AMP-binding protein [Burkholderiales bacterium]